MEKMGRKICLDSDILIDILRGKEEAIQKIKSIEAELCTTSPSIFEIWYGKRTGEEIVNRAIDIIETFPLDKNSAKLAAEILLKLEKSGAPIEFKDIFIGAICITNDLPLITNNKKHFERLREFGLKLL